MCRRAVVDLSWSESLGGQLLVGIESLRYFLSPSIIQFHGVSDDEEEDIRKLGVGQV